jgi:hypothetical protein
LSAPSRLLLLAGTVACHLTDVVVAVLGWRSMEQPFLALMGSIVGIQGAVCVEACLALGTTITQCVMERETCPSWVTKWNSGSLRRGWVVSLSSDWNFWYWG